MKANVGTVVVGFSFDSVSLSTKHKQKLFPRERERERERCLRLVVVLLCFKNRFEVNSILSLFPFLLGFFFWKPKESERKWGKVKEIFWKIEKRKMGSLSFDRDAFSDTVMAASLKPSWSQDLSWEQGKQKHCFTLFIFIFL